MLPTPERWETHEILTFCVRQTLTEKFTKIENLFTFLWLKFHILDFFFWKASFRIREKSPKFPNYKKKIERRDDFQSLCIELFFPLISSVSLTASSSCLPFQSCWSILLTYAMVILCGTLLQTNGISTISAHCTNGANMHVSFHRNFNQTYSLSAEQTVTAFLRKGQNARYVCLT